MDDIVYRIRLLLVLLGCDIRSVEYEGVPKVEDGTSMEEVEDAMRYMWECLEGRHRTVTLERWREKETEDVELWRCEWDALLGAAVELTKWTENTEGLLRLPERFIEIGGEWYGVPDALMQDVSYEQYGVVQGFMTAYWGVVDKVVGGAAEGTGERVKYEESELREMAEKLVLYQKNFVSALLVKTEKTGSGRMVKLPYSAVEQEDVKEKMEGMPEALFGVLLQYVQSVLGYYKKAYPHLFSGSGGKKQRNTFVAEQGVIIGLMMEGGFSSVEAVRQAEVGMVFKALDMLQEKAEEVKRSIARSKAKGK